MPSCIRRVLRRHRNERRPARMIQLILRGHLGRAVRRESRATPSDAYRRIDQIEVQREQRAREQREVDEAHRGAEQAA